MASSSVGTAGSATDTGSTPAIAVPALGREATRSRLGGRGNGSDASRLRSCVTNGAGTYLFGHGVTCRRTSPRNFREAPDVGERRPGFGVPHEQLLAVVAGDPPAATDEVRWGV